MSNQVVVQNPEQVELNGQDEALPVYRPAVNVTELEHAILLEAELPGVRADNLEISVDKRQLTLTGLISNDAPEGYESVYNELPRGKYQRIFNLAEVIDISGISADLNNGLLTLTLPKRPDELPRKIDINVA